MTRQKSPPRMSRKTMRAISADEALLRYLHRERSYCAELVARQLRVLNVYRVLPNESREVMCIRHIFTSPDGFVVEVS